jgi:cytochrome c oxidase cbb3-type subunit 3
MKFIRIIFIFLLVLGIQPAFAEDGQLMSSDMMNYIGYGAIVFTLILVVVVMLVLLRTFRVLAKVLLGPEGLKEVEAEKIATKEARKAERGNVVNKLLSLRPMSEEGSLLMEGDYDGIRELNNPTPAWFMYLFYVTIAFAVGYLLIYHVFGVGQLQYDEYKTEMAIAAKEKAAYLAKSANKVDENTVKLTTDATTLSAGKAIFTERCAACHGNNGQGMVGPNLTDDYWLHGNKINDVFKTIKYGVASKGMPTWENQLTPKQISDVANFVKSLHGTNPANPKEPQGDKVVDDGQAAKSATKTALLEK